MFNDVSERRNNVTSFFQENIDFVSSIMVVPSVIDGSMENAFY